MKLHLGCGDKNLNGYINIDIRYLPGVDRVDNIKFLRKYQVNSISEIYACHVLEHFSRWEYMSVLSRWYDILAPKGILKIAVPDFESVVNVYLKRRNLKELIGLLYGGQDYDENFHFHIWDFETLKLDLKSTGFINIKKYNWQDTTHALIDDYSKSYIPHMDIVNGALMSLNVIAEKA